MSQDLVTKKSVQSLSELVANADANIFHTLKNSIYPGAKDESIGMVLAYCAAKKYDPLAKAVHIVQMKVKTGKKAKSSKGFDYDVTEDRDVIMPGIASYRIDASRTGAYAGMTEPEFGPMIKERLGESDFTYPEWCKITVKKFLNGQIVEFTAVEYWIENYATGPGKDNLTPNAMWKKRKYGQLAKCTEAQALRKAFPDAIGNIPTFEEMEGKALDEDLFLESKNSENPAKSREEDFKKKLLNKANISEDIIDGKTGEIVNPVPLQPSKASTKALSVSELKFQINQAKNEDDINIVLDLKRELTFSKDEEQEINKAIYLKKKEFIK